MNCLYSREMYYFEKGGLSRDLDKAVRLFKKAAKQSDPDARMNLAMLSGTGEGLPLNTENALAWMLQAREAGHESAFDYQKMLMASGNGQFTEEQKKHYWIEKAAELGIREAQEALGMFKDRTEIKTAN